MFSERNQQCCIWLVGIQFACLSLDGVRLILHIIPFIQSIRLSIFPKYKLIINLKEIKRFEANETEKDTECGTSHLYRKIRWIFVSARYSACPQYIGCECISFRFCYCEEEWQEIKFQFKVKVTDAFWDPFHFEYAVQ